MGVAPTDTKAQAMTAAPDRARSYDVAVVGAGVFGSWTAYTLARAGRKVALLDAYGTASSRASSGGESRIIRMGYGADELYTRWSARALVLWREFFARTGRPLFHQTGMLWMAHDNETYANQTLATLERCSVPHEKLMRAELEKRYPQIAFENVTWGILEPESGVLMARRAVQAVVEQAERDGVEYWQEAVETPEGRGRLANLRTRSGATLHAESFVFACGPWLPKVFPEILGARIFPTRQEVFFFGAPAGDARFESPALPTWINLGDEMYGMPDLENRGVKIAYDRHGAAIDPDTAQRAASPEGLQFARNYLGRRFPALRDAPMLESRVCQYENTSNGDFLIDVHPALENVWLVGGGSGHGFKHGPAMGEYVAARVTGGSTAEPRFSLATKATVQKRAIY